MVILSKGRAVKMDKEDEPSHCRNRRKLGHRRLYVNAAAYQPSESRQSLVWFIVTSVVYRNQRRVVELSTTGVASHANSFLQSAFLALKTLLLPLRTNCSSRRVFASIYCRQRAFSFAALQLPRREPKVTDFSTRTAPTAYNLARSYSNYCELTAAMETDLPLPLIKAFEACQSANIMTPQTFDCCRKCSAQLLQRIEACPNCRGMYTGYIMYTLQAALHAVATGDLWLAYGLSQEEVCPLT